MSRSDGTSIRREIGVAARRRRLVALATLGGLLALALGAAAQEPGPVRYRDVVFERVTRTADIVYGEAVDIPTGAPRELALDLYEPTGDTAASRPVLLFVHGGGFVSGDKSAGRRWAEAFAKRGWVSVSIGYRLSQGDVMTVGMPAAVSDARQAVAWLQAHADAYRLDVSRIAIGGSSAGAITSLFLAYTDLAKPDPVAPAGVAAVMDLWGGLYGREDEMTAGEPPLVIVHGTEDAVVPFRLAEALRDRAAAVGIPHAFHPLEGVGHGSRETEQIAAWSTAFFYPLLWPDGPTDPTPTAAPSATASPTAAATSAPGGTTVHLPWCGGASG